MELKRRLGAFAISGTILAATAFASTGVVAAAEMGKEATYRVTITNLAAGQPLTPPVVVLHEAATSIVEAGAPASPGLAQLAENGDPSLLLEALAADGAVGGVAVGDHPIVAGGVPGAAEIPSFATIEVSGDRGANRISVASMLICTNDGFSIVHDAKLPKKVGQRTALFSHAYDAGSERNTEAFTDLVPPCQAIAGVSGEAEGTGMSDPALAEGGTVSPHPGIAGEADLDTSVHAVAENPALVVVERIS